MRLRFLIPLGMALAAGCASNCQTCRAWVVPSGQADDAAPGPPMAPNLDEEELPELPPVPAPTPPKPAPPAPRVKGGTVRHVSTREVEGQAIVIDGNTGVVTIGSSGVPAAQFAAPAVAMAQPVAYPLIPGPVPDAVVFGLGRRLLRAGYVLATGDCPPPRPVTATAFMPVQTTAFVPVQVQQAPAVQYVQAAAPAPVQYVQAPAPQQAPAPMASPQAPRKGLFHFGR
jgi:hypothetical protein